MSITRHKWNDENRHNFYADLLMKFGEWKYWATKLNPYSNKDADREKHDEFNRYLKAKYPNKKPLAQLSWLGNMSALGLVPDPNSKLPTHQKPLVTQQFNHRNWWSNKIAAYYAGFVGDEVFPDTFDPHYPINRKEAWGQDRVEGNLNKVFDILESDDKKKAAAWGDFTI